MRVETRKGRRVLLIEQPGSENQSRGGIREDVSLPGIVLERVSDFQMAIGRLEDQYYDLLLFISGSDQVDAVSSLQQIQARHLGIPVVVVSDSASVSQAVETMKMGAVDYIVRHSATPSVLTETILEAIERSEGERTHVKEIEHLRRLSVTDPLTGLFNRRYLFQVIEREMNRSERYGSPLAFAMVDIDLFKSINDHYGHLVGDSILRRFASYLHSWVRTMDIICRYGGDEFGIVLPNTNSLKAHEVAKRLCSKLGQAVFPSDGKRLRISVSIGVASLDQNPSWRGIDLIRFADEALYLAKQGGRNQISLWKGKEGESEKPSWQAPSGILEDREETGPVQFQGK